MSKYTQGSLPRCSGCKRKTKWHVQDEKGHYYFCDECHKHWKKYGVVKNA